MRVRSASVPGSRRGRRPGDRGRFSEWLGKDLYLGPLTKPADTNRSLIGMMDVVENRHTHRLAPKNRSKMPA